MPVISTVLRDDRIVSIDALAPVNFFDGTVSSSLFLGDGWDQVGGSAESGDWKGMSWVVGKNATAHFLVPPGGNMDLFARCLPYPWEANAPQQTMELLLGDRVLSKLQLLRDWANVRIPLPDGLPVGDLMTLRLRFANATKPEEWNSSPDPRNLAAAFTQIAIIPRSVQDPEAFLSAHSFDLKTGKAKLPDGGGLRIPLPPNRRMLIHFCDVQFLASKAQFSVELRKPGGSTSILRVLNQNELKSDIDVQTGPGGIHSLWIRASIPGASNPSTPAVSFVLDSRADALKSKAPQETRPNVIIYMIDTLRADALEPYGGEHSPSISAFAGDSVTYLEARAPSSWTLPSVVSLLTGVYSDRHGVMTGDILLDPERSPTLQKLLGKRGYNTVAISHSSIISEIFHMHAGFNDFFIRNHLNGRALQSEEARGLFAVWLLQLSKSSPFFAYLHTVDPHAPYAPPAELISPQEQGALALPEANTPQILLSGGSSPDRAKVERLRRLYLAEVRYSDEEFGRFINLLKWLDLYENSFIIVVGDHGEEFAEHGGVDHGTTLFEEVLKVPLIVKYPKQRWAGRKVADPASLVDIAPTVMAELGFSSPSLFDGSLLPPGTARKPGHTVYFEVAPNRDALLNLPEVNLRGLVTGNLKCIEDLTGKSSSNIKAFDLSSDKLEQHVVKLEAAETSNCRRLLNNWSSTRLEKVNSQRSRREAPPESLERLRALGYLH